ncbi:MAG: chorismate-binding protein [Candidatus Eremiobacteraeota bacterium]|nr:chorismate-binding protein [Candidatus Eremiobacteraeota bacterium]
MRVLVPGPKPLFFEGPSRVLRADCAADVPRALKAAQAAIDSGRYCAGYLSYELGAALAGRRLRTGRGLPLLSLGIFERPLAPPLADGGTYALSAMRSRVDSETYAATLRRIARAIFNGDVYQINYTVPFEFAFAGDPYALFTRLLADSGVAHAAFVQDDRHALVSMSPELFLRIQNGTVIAKPMKGTAALDRIGELSSPKNRAEHVMIVDLLRNDLQQICSAVDVPALYAVERYPAFATMTSTITGRLRAGVTIAQILAATFPCGSVTGAPKRAAMDLIERLERWPRDAYTGSIGYFAPDGSAEWNVAIRTLQIDTVRNQGRLDIGGGIVADSNSTDEWAEIGLKRRFSEASAMPFALLETFAGDRPREVLTAHVNRLQRSAAFFNIPVDSARLLAQLEALPAAPDSIVRVRVDWSGALSIYQEAISAPSAPVRVCLARRAVRSDVALLAHKTSWRDVYERAYALAQSAHCFDAICSNERDELTEGTRTSLFVDCGGVLYTPPLASGVLPGILRESLLKQGRCVERVLYEEDITRAGKLYVGNSARGLLRAEFVKELAVV